MPPFWQSDIEKVEREVKLPIALVAEIIVDGTRIVALAEPIGIENVVPLCQSLVTGFEKTKVLKGGQDDQLAAVTNIGIPGALLTGSPVGHSIGTVKFRTAGAQTHIIGGPKIHRQQQEGRQRL